MSEEKQIIDGVNVAGCKYLCTNQMGNNCLNHNQGFSMNCKNNNCYYNQLQRLKAENEKLKDCFRFLETNLTIIRNDFLTCMSECLAALEDESEVQQ